MYSTLMVELNASETALARAVCTAIRMGATAVNSRPWTAARRAVRPSSDQCRTVAGMIHCRVLTPDPALGSRFGPAAAGLADVCACDVGELTAFEQVCQSVEARVRAKVGDKVCHPVVVGI